MDQEIDGSGAALLDGAGENDVFIDVPVESDGPLDAPLVSKTVVTGVMLTSEIWRNTLTVPSTTADTLAITGYHLHQLFSNGPVVSNFRYLPVETYDGDDRTPFERLTASGFEDGLADSDLYTRQFGGGDEEIQCGQAGSGNFSGVVVTALDPLTTFSECGYLWVQPFKSDVYGGNSPGWAWESSDGALESAVDPDGNFGFEVPESGGVYRLQFRPNFSESIPETTLTVKFTVTGGGVSAATCDSFSLDPQGPADPAERCDGDWQPWNRLDSPDNRFPFLAPPANVVGQVLTPEGDPIPSGQGESTWVSIERPRSNGPGGGWYFGGSGDGASTTEQGKFLMRLGDGSYQLAVESPESASYPRIRVYLKVSENGSTIERCDTVNYAAGTVDDLLDDCTELAPMSWQQPLQLQFSEGDLVGQVLDNGSFWVEVQKKNSSGGDDYYEGVPESSSNANQNGVFAVTFPEEDGDYKLFLQPRPDNNSGATRSEVLVNVTIVDGVKTLYVEQNKSEVTPNDEGRYVFVFNAANFVLQVTDPADDPVANSWVSFYALEEQGAGGRYDFNRWVDAAGTRSDGKAGLSLTEGYYKLVANNPTDEPYADLTAYVKVVGSGDDAVFYRCSDFDSEPSEERSGDTSVDINDALDCDGPPEEASSTDPFVLQFEGADFRGQVAGLSFFWVELQRLNLDQCSECYEWIGGVNANRNGFFGFNFETAGTYRIAINPPWNDSSGATRTEVTVVVTGTPGAFSYVVTRGDTVVQPTAGTYQFTMSSANFAAVVLNAEGDPERYPNASFERWNSSSQRFEWSSNWANGNFNGQVSASLADGTWKVTVRPGFMSAGEASPATYYVVISGGVVSAAKVATTKACAESASLTPCTRIDLDADSQRYELPLGSPNFSGYVGVSSSIARDPVTGAPSNPSDAVGYSWIEIREWNTFEQQYRWSPEVSGADTSSAGRFAVSLPSGNASSNPQSRYLVLVNARPQDAAAGRSRGSFQVKVVGDDVVCEVEYSFCVEGGSPENDQFDLYLNGANLTGTVTAGVTPVSNGQVRAERWNGQWFEWVNLWAQTSSGDPENAGKFALNLEEVGTYKVTAEAPTWKTTFAGFANVYKYVHFDGSKVCEVPDPNDAQCDGSDTATLDLDIALAGANVIGSVSSAAGVVRNGWVNVMRYNSVLGWWEWDSGVPVSFTGGFSISLSPNQDGDSAAAAAGTQQRFKIEVMPPWGDSSLTRTEVELWVGDVDGNGTANADAKDYRVCAKSTLAACTVDDETTEYDETDVLDDGDTLAVLLMSGNLTGTVTSDETAGMPNSWINVEKWTTPSWARGPMWQWVPVNANTNDEGVYNLGLRAQGDGYYRITANPGWNNPDNLTRTSKVVLQDETGKVCEVTDANDTECNVSDANPITPANPYTLDIQLAGSNLVGTLKNGGDNVGFAWIGFMREQNNSGLGNSDARSNTWYEWLGGANTTGGFGLRIESEGRYQLEVNPPWSSTLTRFSVYLLASDPHNDGVEPGEIRICTSKSESNTDCSDNAVWSAGSNSQLSFPQANVAIRVCGKDDTGTTCTPVPNSWVNVFSGFEWIGGANTNNLGIARFSLPAGTTYRFEANPNWSNPDGSRVQTSGNITVKASDLTLDTTTVTLGGAVIAVAAGQIDLRLGKPNVTGRVFYKNASEQSTLMPWSYVGVRENLGGNSYNWLPGASVDGTGTFRLTLEDGSYTLTAYPNPNLADRAPASLEVTVTGRVASCTDSEDVDGCSIDFDAAVKNVVFTMTNMGTFTRTLYVYDSADNLVTTVSKPPVAGTVAVSFALPDGTYRLRVQALNTVGTDGTTPIVDFSDGSACRSITGVVIAGGLVDPASQTALNLWAARFEGDDATTGLECK